MPFFWKGIKILTILYILSDFIALNRYSERIPRSLLRG